MEIRGVYKIYKAALREESVVPRGGTWYGPGVKYASPDPRLCEVIQQGTVFPGLHSLGTVRPECTWGPSSKAGTSQKIVLSRRVSPKNPYLAMR